MGASQHHNPVLGCLSVIYLLSAPGSAVGPQVASHAPPLCLSLAPRLYLRPRALRGGLMRQCKARGLVGPRGCTSTPAAACLSNPHFHGRRTAAHWWLRRGTATRALVLVGWLTRWIRAVVGRSQAGWAAAHATRPCSGCPHPPPDRVFGGRKLDQKPRTGPFIGLYMRPKPPPSPLLVASVCREQQGAATCRTGSDMALHRRVFSKRKCGPEGVAGNPSTAVWRALRPIPLASGRPLPLSSA